MARLKECARKVFTVCVVIPLCAFAIGVIFVALAAVKVSDD